MQSAESKAPDCDDLIEDPVIRLEMPGCFFLGINRSGRKYFRLRGVEFPSHSAHIPLLCLCDMLGGAHAYLARYCQFERAYKALKDEAQNGPVRGGSSTRAFSSFNAAGSGCSSREKASWGPEPIAFHFNRGNGTRRYELFIVYAWLGEAPDIMHCRLLPLPSETFSITLKDSGHAADDLSAPEFLDVSFSDARLPLSGVYRTADIIEPDLLNRISGFFRGTIEALESGNAAPETFLKLLEPKYEVVAEDLPRSVTRLFSSRHDSQSVASQLRDIWRHPLDAPALIDNIMPRLWEAIRGDKELRYLPLESDQHVSRDQYLRARLPLSELESQDRYFAWVELPDNWTIEEFRTKLHA